jgi:hypothetical protein
METAFVPLSQGGEGGKGGDGGKGGLGGRAGAILPSPEQQQGGGAAQIPMAATGSEGGQGASGAFGVPGNRGDDGATEIRVDQKAADVIRRAPKSLIENLLF